MANPITGHLPHPHECISIEAEHWFGDRWNVRYFGTPQQLAAAGVVDDDMARMIMSRKGGSRVCKDGTQFLLRNGRVPAHIQWARDEAVVLVRKARSAKQLLQLPGIATLLPNGIPAIDESDDDLTHDELTDRFPSITLSMAHVALATAMAVGASSVLSASLRVRAVGRRQRTAQWLSIGKLIAPNFISRGAA